jgi:hypothetical protein
LSTARPGEDQLSTGDRLQDVSWTTARIYQTNRSQDHSEDRDPNQYFFFRKLAHGQTTSACPQRGLGMQAVEAEVAALLSSHAGLWYSPTKNVDCDVI